MTGTGPDGTPEHWSSSVRGEQAGQFMLSADPGTGKVRFMLPIPIVDAMRAAAERQFARKAD